MMVSVGIDMFIHCFSVIVIETENKLLNEYLFSY